MNDEDKRGLICHLINGSSLALEFPKQSENEAAALLKLENVLESRQLLFEADGRLYIIPFENLRYVRVYPAPANIPGHTYIKGASINHVRAGQS